MKKFLSIICVGIVAVAGVFTHFNPSVNAENEHTSNVLIAYFSRTGENYNVGTIEKGNTEIIAEIIADETGGTLFEISTVKAYPDDYMETVEIARDEKNQNARPELSQEIVNFDDYDVVFLGYPIWHADLPMAMYTFMESYDFSDKIIIPFNTHEGSGQSGTVNSIRQTCDGAEVMNGFSVRGTTAQNDIETSRTTVKNWLETNDFKSLVNTEKPLYTTEDLHNLQYFLLAKETPDLKGKKYDLDGDGVWSVFDLCLMRREVSENIDAVSSATQKINTDEVVQLFNERCDAMTSKDTDTLDRMMSDDLILYHITGAKQTKQEWLDCIKNEEMRYHNIDIKNLTAEIKDDYVIISHTCAIEATIYGSHGTWTLSGNSYYKKINGEWLWVNAPDK